MRLIAKEVVCEIDGASFWFRRLTWAERAAEMDAVRAAGAGTEGLSAVAMAERALAPLARAIVRVTGLVDEHGAPYAVPDGVGVEALVTLLGRLDPAVIDQLQTFWREQVLALPRSAEGN